MKVSLRLQFMSKKRWDIDTMQEQEALLWLKVEIGSKGPDVTKLQHLRLLRLSDSKR